MQGVAILRIKQYGEYQLSTIIDRGEKIKNCEYLHEFGVLLKKPSDTH